MTGPVSEICNGLLDWYWRHGVQRAGEHDLSGAWLDLLYQVRDASRAGENARAAGRPSLALWGPSQSGKSTLLSRYLDAPAKPEASSALQWAREEPVAFVGRADFPGCLPLNPFNQQRDASGCVTRFRLCAQVPSPQYPVELSLASEEQLVHALAAGYLMECDPRDANGRELFLDAALVEKQLASLGWRQTVRLRPQRVLRERLQARLNVLDDLIAADWPRYRNLRPDWKSLRLRLASEPTLAGDPTAFDEVFAWLFWDAQPVLTSLLARLAAQRQKILALAGGQPIRCSYAVARLFLDIDAFRKLDAETPGANRGAGSISAAAVRLGWTKEGAGLCLGLGLPQSLLAETGEFGLWQGLVWEMALPVNSGLLPETSPATALLRAADLLDFPGVALSYPGGARPKIEDLPPARLLTEVLKRGKTASIAISRSRQLGIDGFSILSRIQAPPAQPTQLLSGVQAWARALGQPWPPPAEVLPLNLVLTFASRLVNGVVDGLQLQRPTADFSPVFEFLHKLGDLANPQWVRFFTTTYPRFDEGRIRGDAAQVEAAAQCIAASPDFQRHLGPCVDSVRAMIRGGGASGDGGNDFLLASLADQARHSRLPALLAARDRDLHGQLAALVAEALPPESAGARRRQEELEKWPRAIGQALADWRGRHPEADAAARVGLRLRALLNVDPESLEPPPLPNQSPDWRGYAERQMQRWREFAKGRDGDWADLGLGDAAAVSRHLGYLADHALQRGQLHRWLRENLGHLAGHLEAAQARRFVALRMNELICFGVNGRPPHRTFIEERGLSPVTANDAIQPRLHAYAGREQLDPRDRSDPQSPHYLGFIAPFLRHLDTVRTTPGGERKPQPGDAELVRLAEPLAAGPASPAN